MHRWALSSMLENGAATSLVGHEAGVGSDVPRPDEAEVVAAPRFRAASADAEESPSPLLLIPLLFPPELPDVCKPDTAAAVEAAPVFAVVAAVFVVEEDETREYKGSGSYSGSEGQAALITDTCVTPSSSLPPFRSSNVASSAAALLAVPLFFLLLLGEGLRECLAKTSPSL